MNTISTKERIENIIQIAKWSDESGLDVFGIGEHHRLDFVTSSYAMILVDIARETKNIKLTNTLSVISTADPVTAANIISEGLYKVKLLASKL